MPLPGQHNLGILPPPDYLELGQRHEARFLGGCFVNRAQTGGNFLAILPGHLCQRIPDLVDKATLNFGLEIYGPKASGRPVSPSTAKINKSFTPRFLNSLTTLSQYLADALCPSQMPRHSFFPSRLMTTIRYAATFLTRPSSRSLRNSASMNTIA